MCLGIPLKIIEINDGDAVGELNGIKRKIRIDLVKNVSVGDFVMVHAGFAIEIMKEEQAMEAIEILKELESVL